MTEEPKWEPVAQEVMRLRVPGGWLYKARMTATDWEMTFVPEPPSTKGMNIPM